MSVILKWQVPIDGPAAIPWGRSAKVTAVRVRADAPEIIDVWVRYARDIESVMAVTRPTREFWIVGTGQPFGDQDEVVGTTAHPTLPLVWHVVAGVTPQ